MMIRIQHVLTCLSVAVPFLFTACNPETNGQQETVVLQEDTVHLGSANEPKGLSVGTQVEDFQATDQYGNTYSLEADLKKGPVVLIFYRGQWCPVCNRHMSYLQDSLQYIKDMGAQLVAISPEKEALLKKTAEKSDVSFTLLHDKDFEIAEAFDVVFTPDQKTIDIYNNRLNANLKEAHSDSTERLPVPATFVIDTNGKIVWRHFDKDYKNRASVSEILRALGQR